MGAGLGAGLAGVDPQCKTTLDSKLTVMQMACWVLHDDL